MDYLIKWLLLLLSCIVILVPCKCIPVSANGQKAQNLYTKYNSLSLLAQRQSNNSPLNFYFAHRPCMSESSTPLLILTYDARLQVQIRQCLRGQIGFVLTQNTGNKPMHRICNTPAYEDITRLGPKWKIIDLLPSLFLNPTISPLSRLIPSLGAETANFPTTLAPEGPSNAMALLLRYTRRPFCKNENAFLHPLEANLMPVMSCMNWVITGPFGIGNQFSPLTWIVISIISICFYCTHYFLKVQKDHLTKWSSHFGWRRRRGRGFKFNVVMTIQQQLLGGQSQIDTYRESERGE